MSRIAGIVLARNEAQHIRACIETLHWADETIVFESYSEDDTVALAREAGATVIQNEFLNYAQQRNDALKAVDTDWVLFLDADERVNTALAEEVRATIANPQHDGYFFPRHNYIFGKLTRHAGWYPDYQMRLLRRGRAWYNPDVHVHEVVSLADNADAGYLSEAIVHYNYRNLKHFVNKQHYYANIAANLWYAQGVRAKPRNFVLQPLREFRRRFIDWKGYKDGLHGLRLSLLMAWSEFDKYRLLRRLTRQQ